jgi:hypothetical protein
MVDWVLAQTVDVPDKIAVGNVFLVTTALPLHEPAQVLSDSALIVYVLVVAGATENVYGLAVIPEIVTGVVPSV